MKNLTVLRALSSLLTIVTLIYGIANYRKSSTGEGWGLVFIMGIIGVGLIGLAIDELLKWIIVDRKWVNIYEAVLLVVIVGLLTWSALYRSL